MAAANRLNNLICDSSTTKEIVMAELKEAPRSKTENGPGVTKEIAPRNTAAAMKSAGTAYAYMRRFAQEMDHLFENFGLQTGIRVPSFLTRGHELLRREAGFVPGTWSPHVDVVERNGQFVVRADLPGLGREDIKVDVEDDLLTIQGERKHCTKEEQDGYCYTECNYGSFYRTIPLPTGAETSKATAQFHNGVLEITMPAIPQDGKKARRIEIGDAK
jgi:HSP20 family protein